MDEIEKIRRLLAERSRKEPGPAYCERFLAEFRERQRREAMSVPVRRLLLERTQTWLASRIARRWLRWGAPALLVLGTGGFIGWQIVEHSRAPQPESRQPSPEASGGAGLGGFPEAAMEPSAVDLMEPSLVQIGWGEAREKRWTPGFQVADGMFVSASAEARLLEPVRVRSTGQHDQARIVLKHPETGLVLIDGRRVKPEGEQAGGERVGGVRVGR